MGSLLFLLGSPTKLVYDSCGGTNSNLDLSFSQAKLSRPELSVIFRTKVEQYTAWGNSCLVMKPSGKARLTILSLDYFRHFAVWVRTCRKPHALISSDARK